MNTDDPTAEPAERTCRNCQHVESRHTKEMFECGYIATFFTEQNIANSCFCHVFVPNDNLEFLELKVKQKEDEKLHL